MTLALAQSTGADPHWVSVDQNEGQCHLLDFGERPDGTFRGTRRWFGQGMLLKCTFFVATTSWKFDLRNAISAGGMFHGDHPPLHYGYNVAFFDAQENLIACDGGGLPDFPAVRGGGATSVTRTMPIPQGLHRDIESYKVAYYESDEPMGTVAFDENQALEVTSTNGDTGETTVKSWPLWKSDGELRGSSFQVRAGSRLLPKSIHEVWRAETTEGICSLHKPTSSDDGERKMQELAVELGETLTLKVKCRCIVNANNAIETSVNVKNGSNKKLHGALYIAFFDTYGNLVGCTSTETATEPHATSPAVKINGRPLSDSSVFRSIMPVPVPLGIEKKITSYKITLYESEKPIGATADEKQPAQSK